MESDRNKWKKKVNLRESFWHTNFFYIWKRSKNGEKVVKKDSKQYKEHSGEGSENVQKSQKNTKREDEKVIKK